MFSVMEGAKALEAASIKINDPSATVRRVVTDSRRVGPGDMFFALKGPNFDGHDFVADAFSSGAVAAVVEEDKHFNEEKRALIRVDTPLRGLGQLASWWRRKFKIPLIAITGSNGKTTVKEMVAGILQKFNNPEEVLVTEGNFNNQIGVPLTLLKLRDTHRFAVVELGMNNIGEISYLSKLANPSVCLITNVGVAHIGNLGSKRAIAHAKTEIFEGMQECGTAIVNHDDEFASLHRSSVKRAEIVDFGFSKNAVFSATFNLIEDGSSVAIEGPNKRFSLRLKVPGVHNVRNALAAVAACSSLDIPAATVKKGLESFVGVQGRMQIIKLSDGTKLIDDTYNASPDSMEEALKVLAQMSGRKIFVMGDMGELGVETTSSHRNIGFLAKQLKIDELYGIGTETYESVISFGSGGFHFDSQENLKHSLTNVLGEDSVVLIKGSRFMGLDRLVKQLVATTEKLSEGN